MTGTQPNNVPSMTEGKASAILANISYKAWWFHLVWLPHVKYLQVGFYAPASLSDDKPILQHGRKWLLSEYMVTSEVVQTALMAVLAVEEHETRENFRYKGQAIHGPHLNVDHLVQALESGAIRLSRRADSKPWVERHV